VVLSENLPELSRFEVGGMSKVCQRSAGCQTLPPFHEPLDPRASYWVINQQPSGTSPPTCLPEPAMRRHLLRSHRTLAFALLLAGVGFSLPSAVAAQATRADSAAILLQAAQTFQYEGSFEVS